MVFSKMLAKGTLLSLKIAFFFQILKGNSPSEASERELPLRHPLFKFSKIYQSSDKGIEKIKVGGSSDMKMYPIVYLKRFFLKNAAKRYVPNRANWVSKMQFFSSSGGHIHPQTPPCPRKRRTWCWCSTSVTAFTALPPPSWGKAVLDLPLLVICTIHVRPN